MKRTILITALLAVGAFVASAPASAQDVAAPKDFISAQAGISLLSTSSVDSAKFTEYRDLSNGVYNPQFSIFGSKKSIDFSIFANNIQQDDQRYFGGAKFGWGGIAFDYNQTPHNMGFNGQSLFLETAPGVWSMNSTLRQQLASAVAATASAARTYTWYSSLLAPTFASANLVDVGTLRKRGNVDFDLGQKLPFDLAFTYIREVKTGSRGASGGDIVGGVTSAVDVPEPVNEVMQDFGVRWAYDVPKKANFHATFNRNIYNDRIDALIIDNPFMAVDNLSNGPASTRFGTPPDSQATRGAFGTQLKFAHQTRVTADAAFGTWTQDAQFLPFTINTTMLANANTPATSLSGLPQQSLNGKVNTTMFTLGFSSRPVQALGVRLRYRYYDMANKTAGIQWNGSPAGAPDRTWDSTTPGTSDAPFGGFVTANPYSAKSARFDGQVSYDIKDLTVEGTLQHAALDRTYREATSGTENNYGFSAVYHAQEWVGFRATVNQRHRTAEGSPDAATFLGYQADEAELKQNRATVDIEVSPSSVYGFTFAYSRRHDDYPNRPVRSVNVPSYLSGADLEAGLLNANYDEYTVEFDVTPGARAEINAFYTYEKNTTHTQRIAGSGFSSNVTDLYGFNGLDKGNTFGASVLLHVVPEKWTVTFNAQHQKIDGLLGMDWTLSPTNTVGLGRVALGGPADITQYDDTKWTTVLAQIDRIIGKMTLSVGYMYEKYDLGDAFQGPIFPQSVLFYMNANDGNYKAHLGFAKLAYRF